MKGTLMIYRPGSLELERQDIGEPTLDVLKAAIDGGYLETVPYLNLVAVDGRRRVCWAFCDEHGKNKDLPYNAAATELWHSEIPGISDYLVGPVVICFGDAEFMEAL